MGRTVIFCGGKYNMEFCAQYLRDNKFDEVVCVDSGLNAAYELKINVNYIMGDCDSVDSEVLKKYQQKEVEGSENAEFVMYPEKKDATDMQLALEWVVKRLPSKIVILGATGGRLDHFLANVNILTKPLAYGIDACIIDSKNKIYLIDHSSILRRKDTYGKYISLQPLTEEVYAVFLRGFKYELNDYTMTIGDSRGVSNEFADDAEAALIEFGDGIIIVTESKD